MMMVTQRGRSGQVLGGELWSWQSIRFENDKGYKKNWNF